NAKSVQIPAGTYFIFNKRFAEDSKTLIALNITKTPGTPGAWINPNDNHLPVQPTEAEKAEAAQKEADKAAAEQHAADLAAPEPDFARTYNPLPAPQLYVAMNNLACIDLEGK